VFSWFGCFFCFVFKVSSHGFAGFLLSTAPDRAGHMGKVFEKKIRSPGQPARRAPIKKGEEDYFSKTRRARPCPGGLHIGNLLYIKGQWLLKKPPYKSLL